MEDNFEFSDNATELETIADNMSAVCFYYYFH